MAGAAGRVVRAGHQVARTALGGGDHVGHRDQVSTEQQRQGVGVDQVGLDLGRGDRLHTGRVGQDQLHAQTREGVGQPVPAAGGFDDRLVGPGELGEVRRQRERRARHAGLFDARALRPIGCENTELPVLVDAGVPHGALLG
jgi:hypothetical protein